MEALHERRGSEAGRRPAGRPDEPPLSGLEFVVGAAIPMTWPELRRFEGRLEVRDAETGHASPEPPPRYSGRERRQSPPKIPSGLHPNANPGFWDGMAVSQGPLGGLGVPDRHGVEGCERMRDMLEKSWRRIDLRED